MSVSEELKRLHELHQAGALSDEEFARAKEKLLQGGGTSQQAGDDFVAEVGKLRRSTTDRWLGGVCGGIARQSGIESWIWRLIFVLVATCLGFGGLIYILMWIFVPTDDQ
ncbi:phage shock protein C (PspC) family protein [Duganella sp. CF458]|uniref:PspC domain-containing protein n=1 Tax=Duganella sp. CF458 TaxID=1884368 RepID=UPI0008F39C1A|nr:PspC domain-containing protein [Duganella sp. CF458]SFG90050.1 phage shock protein C (PspC) family protein [Duganella sp. CF458]